MMDFDRVTGRKLPTLKRRELVHPMAGTEGHNHANIGSLGRLGHTESQLLQGCVNGNENVSVGTGPDTAARKKVAFAKKHRQTCHRFHFSPVLLREVMGLSDEENRGEGHTKGYYQAIASQEEIYHQEVEEDLRAILTSYIPSPMKATNSLNERWIRSVSWPRV